MELPPIEPVFVKARDIMNFKAIKEIDMCEAVTKQIRPENVFGVQRIGILWRIYITNEQSRLTLLTQNIVIGEQTVECFSNNPLRSGLKQGEQDEDIVKLVIKGIPLSKGNDLIKTFLEQRKINLRLPIQNGKLRDKNNTLLDVYSGDRIVFVEIFPHPLPRRVKLGDNVALIYHKGQTTEIPMRTNCFQMGHTKKACTNPAACMLCKNPDHKAGDDGWSATAKNPHKSVIPFQGHTDPLSNFFPVKDGISIFGLKMQSAEHAYQYSKAQQSGQDEVAKRILTAKNGKIAKDEASFLPYNPDWASTKEQVMKQILEAKANCCPEFKSSLLKTDNNIIAEAV